MSIEIRCIDIDEVGDYLRAVMRGFHVNKVSDVQIDLRRNQFEPGRFWVAIDGTAIVGTVRTTPVRTTMPGGGELRTAGVTNVTVAATHRRRGLMAKMVGAELHAARDRGEPVSSLIAAEWPIYGRFGFGPALDYTEYELDTRATFTNPGEGTIEMVDPATLLTHAPAVYEQHRVASAGEITRNPNWWKTITHAVEVEPWDGFQVLCRDDAGTVTGYAIYSVKEAWERRKPLSALKLDEMIATNLAAEARLWRYLCEIDLVRTVTAESRRLHEPLQHWVTDGRALTLTERSDMVWARTLDTPAALSGRAYAGAGSVVFDVDDPMKLAGGRFRLDTDGASASCTPTADAPDVALSMSALGAILYGCTSIVDLHLGGLVTEHQRGAVVRTDALFRWPVTPWSTTWF
jgi:predicted acetyltransferase